MAYKISLHLPAGWESKLATYKEAGVEISHFQAFLPDDKLQADKGAIDIYAGPLPEGSNAEQEAYNSYCEMFGQEEAEQDEDPLFVWPFQGCDAFGYEALCEDDSPMRFMSVELMPGTLVLVTAAYRNDIGLQKILETIEKGLKITQG